MMHAHSFIHAHSSDDVVRSTSSSFSNTLMVSSRSLMVQHFGHPDLGRSPELPVSAPRAAIYIGASL